MWNYSEGDTIVDDVAAWRCLSSGDRCDTWLGWSSDRCAPVIIKLVREDEAHDAVAVSALAREVRIMARLSHPFLPTLYRDGTASFPPHFVMEYVEGPSLAQILAVDGTFSPTDTVTLGLQIAMALHYLHHLGIAHLDVKPGNVVLRDGRVVLIDLGGSRPIGSPAPSGPVWGTENYMAPEYANRGPASIAVDLFALGATLAELVSGRTPGAHGGLRWKPRSNAGWRLAHAIEQLCAADPRARPADVGAAMTLLRTVRPDVVPPWPSFVTIGRTVSPPQRAQSGQLM